MPTTDSASTSPFSVGLAGQHIEVYDFADRPMEVRWQGHVLPYHVFDRDQRVNLIAVVENLDAPAKNVIAEM
jgi:hypothetical protein